MSKKSGQGHVVNSVEIQRCTQINAAKEATVWCVCMCVCVTMQIHKCQCYLGDNHIHHGVNTHAQILLLWSFFESNIINTQSVPKVSNQWKYVAQMCRVFFF